MRDGQDSISIESSKIDRAKFWTTPEVAARISLFQKTIMKSKQLILIGVIALVGVVAGLSFDHWRSGKKTTAPVAATSADTRNVPPLPQWGALLPAGDDVEVSGSAMCGWCAWGVGEKPDNIVLQMSTEPGIVFVLPNEKRAEIEKFTNRCAGGEYWITAHGTVTQYDGHNYLLVKNFDAVKTK